MKRFALFCLLALTALGVTACGSSSKKTTTTTASAPVHTVTDAASGVVSTATTVDTTTVVTAAGTTSASKGLASLGRPFSAQSLWNTRVANAALATNSTFLMRQAEFRYGVVVKGNSLENIKLTRRRITKPLFINTHVWTDPIVFTSGSNSVTLTCRQINLPPPHNDCGDGWDLQSLPVPVSGFPKPSYDGWLTVIDQGTGYAYDFWRARFTNDNSVLSYQFVRRWQLNGPGFLPPGYVAARGSGLPMFAGELLPRDIRSGHVNHALAISVPGPAANYYVQPASSTDGNGLTNSLPEGARIRLKASFSIAAALAKLPGQTNVRAARAVLQALKTYGAIVVDRSAVPTLYAVPNFNWDQPLRAQNGKLLSPNGRTELPAAYQNVKRYGTPLLSGNVVQSLTLDDFQVIGLPNILQYPPLPKSAQIAGVNGVQPQAVDGEGTTDSTQITQQTGSSGVTQGLLP